jgi:hypothetical protein
MFQNHLKKYAPGFDTLRFSRLTADWPVENMNNDVTSYGMSLCITQKKTNSKKNDKRSLKIPKGVMRIQEFNDLQNIHIKLKIE